MNRRLFRSPDDRVLAGVAGGMAETYGWDPAMTRVIWALLIIFTFPIVLIAYIVMALVVPLREEEPPAYAGEPRENEAAGAETTTPGSPATPPWSASPTPGARARRRSRSDSTAPLVLGALLVIVGGLFLLREFIPINIGQLWPIAVIVLGVLLIVSAFGRREARE